MKPISNEICFANVHLKKNLKKYTKFSVFEHQNDKNPTTFHFNSGPDKRDKRNESWHRASQFTVSQCMKN